MAEAVLVEVPAQDAVFADKLDAAPRRPGQVVHVNRRGLARVELQHDVGNVLRVDLERAGPGGHGGDPTRRTQQPAHRVQRVAQRQHGTAAEVETTAVAVAVVLPRVPVGQVLAVVGPRAEYFADRVLVDERLEPFEAGVERQVVAHHQLSSCCHRRLE